MLTCVDQQWVMLRNKATLSLWPTLTGQIRRQIRMPIFPRYFGSLKSKGTYRDTVHLGDLLIYVGGLLGSGLFFRCR
jgi:hypothetical protein